jgi:nucleoside-diphosphate-sugar epimerase
MVSGHALVTGATGGFGRALVQALLERGYEVRGTGRDETVEVELAAMGASFRRADLTSDALVPLVEGIDVVFHLAALSAPWGRMADFRAINIEATRALLAAAQAAGCARFVHISTPSIYAEPRSRLGLTEDSPPARRFANAYAATKYAGEQLVRAADGPDLRTVVLRPRAIVGPHDRVLLPRLMRAVESGRVPLPGGGAGLVELTDVRDVIAATIAAAETDAAAGRAFNISGGVPMTTRAVVERVCAALGKRPRLIDLPVPVAMMLARAAELGARLRGREPQVTRYAVMTLAWSQTFDLRAARDVLGWIPRVHPDAAIAHALKAA